MIQTLAQAMSVPPETMVSSATVTGIIGGITTLVVGIIGKLKIDQVRAAASDVTIRKPVPTIKTEERPVHALKPDLDAHIARTEKTIREIRDELGEARKKNSHDISNLHNRMDKQVIVLARVEGSLESVQETTGKLLDIALGKKPSTRQ